MPRGHVGPTCSGVRLGSYSTAKCKELPCCCCYRLRQPTATFFLRRSSRLLRQRVQHLRRYTGELRQSLQAGWCVQQRCQVHCILCSFLCMDVDWINPPVVQGRTACLGVCCGPSAGATEGLLHLQRQLCPCNAAWLQAVQQGASGGLWQGSCCPRGSVGHSARRAESCSHRPVIQPRQSIRWQGSVRICPRIRFCWSRCANLDAGLAACKGWVRAVLWTPCH